MPWKAFAVKSLLMPKFRIAPEICVFAAAVLLLLPIRFLAAVVVAVTVHELGHWLALRLSGAEVYKLTVLPGGCIMETGTLSRGREVICALAGPTAGAFLVLLARWMPLTAICAGIHTFYNLLPVYPLDGGRALGSILVLLLGEREGNGIFRCVELMAVGLLLAAGILGTVLLDLGIVPLLIPLFLCLRVVFRKIPCKKSLTAVQ